MHRKNFQDSIAVKLVLLGALILAWLAGLGPAVGLRAAAPKEIPVNDGFRDFPGDSATPPDRIKSDGLGLYVNGIDNVDAVFMTSGNIRLVTNTSRNSAIRRLFLDLGSLAISVGGSTPFLSGLTQAEMRNHLLNPDGSLNTSAGLLNIPLNQSAPAAVGIRFPDTDPSKNLQWRIAFGDPQYPQADKLVARHLSDSQGDFWSLSADYPSDVAVLLSAPARGNTGWTIQGYYHMPFQCTIRKQ